MILSISISKIFHVSKLILVCGPAAIGKSTFSNNYKKANSNELVKVIAADEVRKDMYGGYDKFPPNYNMLYVYKEMIKRAEEYRNKSDDVTVIFDTTMLYDERRLYFIRHLKNFDYFELILLKLHDYSACLERNKLRPKEKWVPENIILDMISHYEDPSYECKAHFNEIKEIYVD
ncbi:MAG TPA: hypothetical protein DEF61_01495 [Firmicutes bacterium]|nr:hypothetical protein [Bacillota bacterium]HBM69840.1 hypothetical protein [Bacillota bacterium]HBX24951.1 hypothetical protein [Bacillota bacterium]